MTDNPYRLPRSSSPQRYDIEIRPDLIANTFTGTVSVALAVHEQTEEIVLNAIELEIDDALLGNRILEVAYDIDTERIMLGDGDLIEPGNYTLFMQFRGVLNDKLHGFYRSTFTDAEGREHAIATTQFEATDARRAFPCWDEPEYKAVFGVKLIIPADLMAISNGAEVSRRRLDDGTIEVTFSDTPKMSTYLVAFIVGPFVATDPVDAGVPLRVVHIAGKERLARFAVEAGAHYLRWLADYYGIPYIGDKMDLIAIPDFAFGAMENLGAVTFRESALLIDPDTAGQVELQRVSEVIAHELAHMWFGDFVTMKWWNGIWLNEAFATFMEMVAQDAWKPEWKTWLSFAPFRALSMRTDALDTTRPVEFPVVAPSEADEMFDVLTYQKGSSLVRMLQQFLGEDTFRLGVKRYLESHAYANTETSDLWDALEETSERPVSDMMQSWIFAGGFPQITVRVEENGIVLTQQRFRCRGTANGSLWKIPVTIRYEVNGAPVNRSLIVDTPQARLDVEGPVETVLVNAGGHGYYRVHYTGDLLDRILERLTDLDPLERFDLVDDTRAQTVTGQISIDTFLDLLLRFRDETEHAIWTTIIGALGEIYQIIEDPLVDHFHAYARTLMAPCMNRLGWDVQDGESDLTRRLRGQIITALGMYGADPDVRERATELLPTILDDTGSLDPEIVRAVITVTADAGTADYATFFEKYRTATTPQDENRFLYALPLFPNPDLTRQTFQATLDGRIRTQNGPFVVAQLLGNRETKGTAWDLYSGHWDEQVELFPPMLLRRTFQNLWALNDRPQEVHRFFRGRVVKHAEKALAQELERLDVMTAYRKNVTDALARYLKAE